MLDSFCSFSDYVRIDQLWASELAIPNFTLADWRSTLSPIESLEWCSLDARMIAVIVGEFNQRLSLVKEYQEKDKIGSKQTKTGSVAKPRKVKSSRNQLWASELAIPNFTLSDWRSTLSPIESLEWCSLDAGMIAVIVGEFNQSIISELPPYSAVTPTEPVDSLSMRDEHLDTIPATNSDEFIKSCVENLVPNPYVPEKIYSNPPFDEEIIPMEIDQHSFNGESDLIVSMPNYDSSVIISSKIDSLFDEFAGELTLLKSFSQGIDETDCHHEKEILLTKRLLYDNSSPCPPEEIVSDNSNADIESFSPSPIPNKDSDPLMEEIDLYFNLDDPMPPSIKDKDYDSGRDISILEEFPDNYSLSLPDNESYHFDIPSPYHPPAKPPDGNAGTLNIKMLGDVSDQKVKEYQEKDKIGSKPDKNEKRGEAEKSQERSQSIKEEN
nr:hypothetical protein [Tanacetum cinerariifolium]